MRGGDIVGIGTQGCVFSPKLTKHTRKNGQILAKRSNNTRHVSKIFTNKDAFNKERRILRTIVRITKGVGTVVIPTDDEYHEFTANALNSENYALLNVSPSPPAPSACINTKRALNNHEKIYIMTQPRILGDIRQLKVKQPLYFFSDAYTALLLFKKYHIRHRDMYARNIFYNEDNALIGDFGHAVDLTNLDHPKSHYSASTFDTKRDLLDFMKAIQPYARMTPEEGSALQSAIKKNNFYMFYDIAGVPRKYVEKEVREYLATFPTEDRYTPPSPKTRAYSSPRSHKYMKNSSEKP
jgi:hypothetical protein